MELKINFRFALFLTTLLHKIIITCGDQTLSSYFVLGVPQYRNAAAEFYLATMMRNSFQVICRVETRRDEYYRRYYSRYILLTKHQASVMTLDLHYKNKSSEFYSSITFESPNGRNIFGITVVLVDKQTGYWMDSMLALPYSMFRYYQYLPWFGKYARQVIVMSAHDDNHIYVYGYEKQIDEYLKPYYPSAKLNQGDYTIFSNYLCGLLTYEKEYFDGGVVIYGKKKIGAIVVACETSFHFTCKTDKTNYPLIESIDFVTHLKSVEFVVFSRLKMSTSDWPFINDELIIATMEAPETCVTINKEETFFLSKSYHRTITINFDYPLHVKADGLIVCYYLSKGKDCTSSMALAWLVPVELFYFSYVFSVPFPYNSTASQMRAYAILVADKDKYTSLLVDGKHALNYRCIHNIKSVTAILVFAEKALVSDVSTTSYQVRYLKISPGSHTASSTIHYPFGLYLYGWKDGGTFLHAAGYAIRKTSGDCTTDLGAMLPGDLVDNDCDGLLDEDLRTADGVNGQNSAAITRRRSSLKSEAFERTTRQRLFDYGDVSSRYVAIPSC
ncbi:uncharacterized protein LOC131949074 [Physella acuta]|uniref:uncharacterized protein LOC131949074 n=1 Tax=Physella acuta TaxID=109671 RepID=UPI0027DC456E|nr:uncharacterized protein LOC131949074 [Physella acuta]